MRRIIFTILCIFTIALTCYGQKVTLQHNGKIVGFFSNSDGTCLTEAFEHAEEGDTLFLSQGDYYLPIIDKAITIIGVGASECAIRENFALREPIKIQAKTNSTISQINLEGISLDDVSVGPNYSSEDIGKIENINIKKSILRRGLSAGGYDDLGNLTFESSKLIGSTNVYTLKNLIFRNCDISYISSAGSKTTLPKYLNCDIVNYKGDKALCINCIIGQVGKGVTDYLETGHILINTLYHKIENYDPTKNCIQQDCYATEEAIASNVDEWGSNNKLIITEEQLRQNNYLGTDGTIIGKSGGARPFNLDMHIPIVTKNNFSIDQNNKKASINVSVTAK